MREAANFLNALVEGKTLSELQRVIDRRSPSGARKSTRWRSDWSKAVSRFGTAKGASERLIVRGRSNLLSGSGERGSGPDPQPV